MSAPTRTVFTNQPIYWAAIIGGLIAQAFSPPCLSQEQQQAAPPAMLQHVLRSMPSSTESLIVMGPYQPKPPTPPKPYGHTADGSPLFGPEASIVKDLTTEWEAYRCNTALLTVDPRLESYCKTKEIELSIFAFRAIKTEFNIPGGTAIEGCDVVVFKEPFEASIQALFDKPIVNVDGIPVIETAQRTAAVGGVGQPRVAGPKAPQVPRERTFVAAPYDRMLVASNSWALMTHVLTALRAESVADNGLRVTRDAGRTRLWGMRRFGPSFARDGTAAVVRRDPGAKRLEMMYDATSDSIALRYISSSRDAEATLQRFFSALGEEPPPVRHLDAETVELTLREPARKWILVLAVLGMLALP